MNALKRIQAQLGGRTGKGRHVCKRAATWRNGARLGAASRGGEETSAPVEKSPPGANVCARGATLGGFGRQMAWRCQARPGWANREKSPRPQYEDGERGNNTVISRFANARGRPDGDASFVLRDNFVLPAFAQPIAVQGFTRQTALCGGNLRNSLCCKELLVPCRHNLPNSRW